MKSIQEKLQHQMKINDIKPYTLAKTTGIPESSIKNIIYGRTNKPGIEIIDALAKKLNCAIVDLLSDDDPRIAKNKQDDELWNGMLYVSALQTVMEIANNKNVRISRKQADIYAERIYQYAMANNEESIDIKFANYIMKDIRYSS